MGKPLSRHLPEGSFLKHRRVIAKDLWTGTPMFEVGDKVAIETPNYWSLKSGNGIVVHIFKAGYTPDPELVRICYQIDETSRHWKSVSKACKVHRYAIRRENEESYLILPEPTIHVLKIRHA